MMGDLAIKRGDVWLTRLDPTEGNEIRKTRPCAIISSDAMNAHLGTVIVMPLTSGSRFAGFRVRTEFRNVSGLLLGDQIRCVSTKRLIRNLGPLDRGTMVRTLRMMREMFEE